MADPAELERSLTRVLWQLRAYLPDLVVVGGWVPHLFQRYGGFTSWHLEALFTREVDVLVDSRLPRGRHASIPDILREAGFDPAGPTGLAAVWRRAPEVGEMVEFLVAHRGTARQLGQVVPVGDQDGLGAVSLRGLQLLRTHTTVVPVPLEGPSGSSQVAGVRIPLLGAYVVNKAATFPRRSPRSGDITNPKRAKDLLYLRDLMAAGEEVVSTIEEDLRRVLRSDASAPSEVRAARNHLRLAGDGALQEAVFEASLAAAERLRVSPEAAAQDLQGHLADLLELLQDALAE